MESITKLLAFAGVKNKLEYVYKEFIYGGHLQCLGAASIVYISAIFLEIDLAWSSVVIAYFLFYPLYLFNRWKEIEIDYATNPARTEYLKTYLRYMPAIFSLVLVLIVGGLAYFGNIKSFIFGIVLLVLGLLYTTVFKKVTRKIFLFKNFYVASFFALLVLFTVVFHAIQFNENLAALAVLMIFVFTKAFMMQILLDLKDVESDGRQGLKTLAVTIGRKNTFEVLAIISIFTTAPIVMFFTLYIPLFPKSMLLFLLTIPFNFISFKIAQSGNYFGYILGSGEFLLWSILIFIGKILL